MPEAPPMLPRRDVRDDVELLARVLERTLEREVVVRADDELVRNAALAKNRRQLCEEPMEWARLRRGLEERVQLVVQRSRALHRRDVLGDAREVGETLARHLERAREMRCQVADAVEAQNGDYTPGEECAHDLGFLVRRRARDVRRRDAGL